MDEICSFQDRRNTMIIRQPKKKPLPHQTGTVTGDYFEGRQYEIQKFGDHNKAYLFYNLRWALDHARKHQTAIIFLTVKERGDDANYEQAVKDQVLKYIKEKMNEDETITFEVLSDKRVKIVISATPKAD